MRWQTLGRVAATVFVGLVVPGAVGAVGIARATGAIYPARDGSTAALSIRLLRRARTQGTAHPASIRPSI
jgi:hypothetical protein